MNPGRADTMLGSAGPEYDFRRQPAVELAPWLTENAFVSGFAYSPEAAVSGDSPTSEYPPLNAGQPDWSALGGSSRSPRSLSIIPCFSGDTLVSPITGWALDTDSDSCDFSPADTRQPMPEVDAAIHSAWSWSQPPSPSVKAGSLPSAFATRPAKPKASASTRAKPTPKLRTASRASRKPPRKSTRSSAASPSELESTTTDEHTTTPEELRARRNHNLVEKQYRNRLNAQFERLLAVLPTDQQRRPAGGGNEDHSAGCDDKRMSKAEVLDVATRRIKELEMERHRLQRERKELLKNMALMNGSVPRVTNQR